MSDIFAGFGGNPAAVTQASTPAPFSFGLGTTTMQQPVTSTATSSTGFGLGSSFTATAPAPLGFNFGRMTQQPRGSVASTFGAALEGLLNKRFVIFKPNLVQS